MAGGRMHTPHPTPFNPPPGHKLQKISKESSIFQSLGIIIILKLITLNENLLNNFLLIRKIIV